MTKKQILPTRLSSTIQLSNELLSKILFEIQRADFSFARFGQLVSSTGMNEEEFVNSIFTKDDGRVFSLSSLASNNASGYNLKALRALKTMKAKFNGVVEDNSFTESPISSSPLFSAISDISTLTSNYKLTTNNRTLAKRQAAVIEFLLKNKAEAGTYGELTTMLGFANEERILKFVNLLAIDGNNNPLIENSSNLEKLKIMTAFKNTLGIEPTINKSYSRLLNSDAIKQEAYVSKKAIETKSFFNLLNKTEATKKSTQQEYQFLVERAQAVDETNNLSMKMLLLNGANNSDELKEKAFAILQNSGNMVSKLCDLKYAIEDNLSIIDGVYQERKDNKQVAPYAAFGVKGIIVK